MTGWWTKSGLKNERTCSEKRNESFRGNREEGLPSATPLGRRKRRITQPVPNLSRKEVAHFVCNDSGVSLRPPGCHLTFPIWGRVVVPVALLLFLACLCSGWNREKWKAQGSLSLRAKEISNPRHIIFRVLAKQVTEHSDTDGETSS